MGIFVTIIMLLASVFWFYAAYLRKIDSDKLKNGAMALPDVFSVKVLITMGVISVSIVGIRLLSLFLGLE